MMMKLLNQHQARWAEVLSVYNFVLSHCPGKDNPTDTPSCQADYAEEFHGETLLPTLQQKICYRVQEGWQHDNAIFTWYAELVQVHDEECVTPMPSSMSFSLADVTEPPLALFTAKSNTSGRGHSRLHLVPQIMVNAAMTSEIAYSDMPDPLITILLHAQSVDTFTIKRSEAICEKGLFIAGTTIWMLSDDGLLHANGRAYVPRQCALIEEILWANHDDPQGGHFGIKHTIEIVQDKYHWWGQSKDISEYIWMCDTCQQVKPHCHSPYGELGTIPMPNGLWEMISMDFITRLPTSTYHGTIYNAILVIVDIFMKLSLYIPCSKDITAEELADLTWDQAFSIFSVPGAMVSD